MRRAATDSILDKTPKAGGHESLFKAASDETNFNARKNGRFNLPSKNDIKFVRRANQVTTAHDLKEAKGSDLLFQHEQEGSKSKLRKNYKLQGDMSLYSRQNIRKRKELFISHLINGQIRQFWYAYEKDADDRISERAYKRVHCILSKALDPKWAAYKADIQAIQDWRKDMTRQHIISVEERIVRNVVVVGGGSAGRDKREAHMRKTRKREREKEECKMKQRPSYPSKSNHHPLIDLNKSKVPKREQRKAKSGRKDSSLRSRRSASPTNSRKTFSACIASPTFIIEKRYLRIAVITELGGRGRGLLALMISGMLSGMDYLHMKMAIFEIADKWTESIDEEMYACFLHRLLLRTTVTRTNSSRKWRPLKELRAAQISTASPADLLAPPKAQELEVIRLAAKRTAARYNRKSKSRSVSPTVRRAQTTMVYSSSSTDRDSSPSIEQGLNCRFNFTVGSSGDVGERAIWIRGADSIPHIPESYFSGSRSAHTESDIRRHLEGKVTRVQQKLPVLVFPLGCLGTNSAVIPETGETMLHIACKYGMVGIAQRLLEKEVDPNVQDIDGRSPIFNVVGDFFAAVRRNASAEELLKRISLLAKLFRCGASDDLLDTDEESVLDVAINLQAEAAEAREAAEEGGEDGKHLEHFITRFMQLLSNGGEDVGRRQSVLGDINGGAFQLRRSDEPHFSITERSTVLGKMARLSMLRTSGDSFMNRSSGTPSNCYTPKKMLFSDIRKGPSANLKSRNVKPSNCFERRKSLLHDIRTSGGRGQHLTIPCAQSLLKEKGDAARRKEKVEKKAAGVSFPRRSPSSILTRSSLPDIRSQKRVGGKNDFNVLTQSAPSFNPLSFGMLGEEEDDGGRERKNGAAFGRKKSRKRISPLRQPMSARRASKGRSASKGRQSLRQPSHSGLIRGSVKPVARSVSPSARPRRGVPMTSSRGSRGTRSSRSSNSSSSRSTSNLRARSISPIKRTQKPAAGTSGVYVKPGVSKLPLRLVGAMAPKSTLGSGGNFQRSGKTGSPRSSLSPRSTARRIKLQFGERAALPK
eukprot:jgi/Bigna1/79860/fgenesh1_pg.65_\